MTWYHEAVVKDQHLDFFTKYVKSFRDSGGSVHVYDPNITKHAYHLIDLNANIQKQSYDHNKIIDRHEQDYKKNNIKPWSDEADAHQNKSDYLYSVARGLNFMYINTFRDEFNDTKKFIVAKTPEGNPTAVLSFYPPFRKKIRINQLGSNDKLQGAATALEYAMAHIASKAGVSIDSESEGDAFDYHKNIGRKVTNSLDSTWSNKDCQNIADLCLFPKSITKNWEI